ncbi:MAG TPA: hypothetical protein VLF95_05070 [Vicinamibacteria bacterium]|nr:hypothetical protein [Vicinamibacteria bacterium]
MHPSSRRKRPLWIALPAFLAPLATPPQACAQGALALARVSLVERRVELAKRNATWQAATEGGPLQVGEALRTGPDAVARLELPWMALTLGPGATLRFPDAFLLSASLEGGRALVEAQGRDALKVVTEEAEVRGQGRAVVRRQGRETLVTCLAGRFSVQGRESTVTLAAGRGTVVRSGRTPSAPEDVPPAPPAGGLWPGKDPVYASPGEPLELRWRGDAPAYQVEVLPVGSDVVLLQRDVAAPPARIEVPWEGAFRWRVSARDGRGLEGMPSEDGLIAVDAR